MPLQSEILWHNPQTLKDVLGIDVQQSLVLSHFELSDLQAHRRLRIRVFDPYTWSWLGLMLAEGVVSFVGGKAFQTAFFHDASNAEVIASLSAKIDVAVREIERYIDLKIEQAVVDDAQRGCASIYRLLQEYTNAPVPGDGRLNAINHDANALWDLIFGRNGAIIPATIVASLKVAALHLLFLEKRSAGNRTNVINFIDLAIGSLSRWNATIAAGIHVFELTGPIAIAFSESDEFIPNPREPLAVNDARETGRILVTIHHCACEVAFRANGAQISRWGQDTGSRDSATTDALNRIMPDYNEWVRRRDVVEPYVTQNIVLVVNAVIAKLTAAKAALPPATV